MDITFEEPTLTAGEELSLARAIEAGLLAGEALRAVDANVAASDDELRVLEVEGERAHRRLVEANLRLVALVAYKVGARGGLDVEVLFQEGVLGLIEAVRRYDHVRGARFATFALPWIRLRVTESAMTRCGEFEMNPGRARRWVRLVCARDRLTVDLGRAPTTVEVAGTVGCTASQADRLLSFVPPSHTAVEASFLEGIAVDAGEGTGERPSVRMLLFQLRSDEREVIERLYGFAPHPAMNYTEVAEALGVSESTVRRRERMGIDRLRGADQHMAVA